MKSFLYKISIFLLFILIFFNCDTSKVIREGEIIKVKIYVGQFIGTYSESEKITKVLTTQSIFRIQNLDVEIPDSVWCYVRIDPVLMDVTFDIASQLERGYFT